MHKAGTRGRHRRRREPRACSGTAAPRWQPPRLAGLMPDERQILIAVVDDATKRLLYASSGPGRHRGGVRALHAVCTPGACRSPLHGPRGLGLSHAQGRRPGGSHASHPGRPRPRPPRHRAHRRLLAAGPGPRGGSIAPFRAAWSMSWPWRGSPPWPRPMPICASSSSPTTTTSSRTRPPIPRAPSCRCTVSTSTPSSVSRPSARWARTTSSPSSGWPCRWPSSRAGVPVPGCASRCGATSTGSSRSGTGRAASGAMMPGAPRRSTAKECARAFAPGSTIDRPRLQHPPSNALAGAEQSLAPAGPRV